MPKAKKTGYPRVSDDAIQLYIEEADLCTKAPTTLALILDLSDAREIIKSLQQQLEEANEKLQAHINPTEF